jgi:hypothetical protein
MKKIVFFNYAHKGDVFLSRPFVDHIMQTIDVEYGYAHYWENYLLKDLNLEYIELNQIPVVQGNNEHASNFIKDEVVYINTWIGKYFSHSKPRYGQCNLTSIYELMYTEIFDFLSSVFNVNLQLKNILEYFPTVDYSYFNISPVNEFLKKEKRKKVLLCNGKGLSGQCEYNGTLDETILKFSEKYPNVCFIVTHKIDFSVENVKYTGDIIGIGVEVLSDGQVNRNTQDVNEISYLSKFCDVIVGRSSGPFTFSNIKDNIFDPNKSFLCFGQKEEHCLPYQLDVECEFIFEQFSTLENLEHTIMDLIENEETI